MKRIIDEQTLNRIFTRLAHEIVERNNGSDNLAVIGIRRRGVQVAQIIKDKIEQIDGGKIDFGVVDTTLYRDDLMSFHSTSPIGTTVIDFDINGRNVILCDDVMFTGRTVRAAISALLDIGRPKKIQFLAVVDRGHRELPFRADYIGKNVPTSLREKISVRLKEVDGEDGVFLLNEEDL